MYFASTTNTSVESRQCCPGRCASTPSASEAKGPRSFPEAGHAGRAHQRTRPASERRERRAPTACLLARIARRCDVARTGFPSDRLTLTQDRERQPESTSPRLVESIQPEKGAFAQSTVGCQCADIAHDPPQHLRSHAAVEFQEWPGQRDRTPRPSAIHSKAEVTIPKSSVDSVSSSNRHSSMASPEAWYLPMLAQSRDPGWPPVARGRCDIHGARSAIGWRPWSETADKAAVGAEGNVVADPAALRCL